MHLVCQMVLLSMTLIDLERDFKDAIFLDIEYLRMTQDRAIIAIEHPYEVIGSLSNGDISIDLYGLLTRFSRCILCILRLNIS